MSTEEERFFAGFTQKGVVGGRGSGVRDLRERLERFMAYLQTQPGRTDTVDLREKTQALLDALSAAWW